MSKRASERVLAHGHPARGRKMRQAEARFSIYDGVISGEGCYRDWVGQHCLEVKEGKPPARVFKQCRYWLRHSTFLRTLLGLKLSFLNYGLRVGLRSEGGKKPGKAALNEFEAWRKAKGKLIYRQSLALWREWLTVDNVLSFWRTEDGFGPLHRPVLLKPEEIEYSDEMGEERIKLLKTFSAEQKKLMSAAVLARYGNGPVVLGHVKGPRGNWVAAPELGEETEVTKASGDGEGLAWPGLYSVFRALSEIESLEVGHNLYSFLYRTIYKQWKKGFDPRGNVTQLPPSVWTWTQKWGTAFEAAVKNKVGVVEMTSPFDVSMQIAAPDGAFFSGGKFSSAIERLQWWAGPVGFMVLAQGITPYLMDLFRQEAEQMRRQLQGHFERVLGEGLDAPGPVEVGWSNRCFKESRVLLEMMKFGVQQGGISLRTFNEELGLDDPEERRRKGEEASAPAGEVLPRMDRSGRLDPKRDPNADKGGRPVGTPDPPVK